MGELVGMFEDYLAVVRFERRVRLADRAHHFLAERGKHAPTRKIPLNIALPLLENATLEEDDELQMFGPGFSSTVAMLIAGSSCAAHSFRFWPS